METEKICANCKFFTNGFFEHDPEIGFTIQVTDDPKDGMCLNPKIGSDNTRGWLKHSDDTHPEDGIYASCDEERGDLYVGKNFGCIHFIEKKIIFYKKQLYPIKNKQ